MNTDPYTKLQFTTNNRTIRFSVCEDVDLYEEFRDLNHVYREAWNKGVEYQLQRPEKIYALFKSSKNPDAFYAMLTEWRDNGELHGKGMSRLQRAALRQTRDTCEKKLKARNKKIARIAKAQAKIDKWNKENPDWDWNKWHKKLRKQGKNRSAFIAERRRKGKKVPPMSEYWRSKQIVENDNHKLFRRRKDGFSTLIWDVPPLKIDGNAIKAPGMKHDIHVKLHKDKKLKCPIELPPLERIRSMRVVLKKRRNKRKQGDLRYPERMEFELHLTVATDVVVPENRSDEILGVDRGVTDTLALSNGICWSYPDDTKAKAKIKKYTDRISTLRKECRKGTRRWRSDHNTKYKILRKKNNCEKNALKQFITKEITPNYDTITIEDLKVTNMMARAHEIGVRSKSGLNRKLSDARFGFVEQTFTIACENSGNLLLTLSAYDSSNTCHACNYIDARNRNKKNKKEFKCIHCGHEDDADVNAGINMEQRGHIYMDSRNRGSNNEKALDEVKTYISKTRSKDQSILSGNNQGIDKTDKLQVEDVQRGRWGGHVGCPKGESQTSRRNMCRRNRVRSLSRQHVFRRLKLYRKARSLAL